MSAWRQTEWIYAAENSTSPTSGAFFGVEVMQVNQIWPPSQTHRHTYNDDTKTNRNPPSPIHTSIVQCKTMIMFFRIKLSFVVSSFAKDSSGGSMEMPKRLVKMVKSKPALKSIRPTEFHTLVNQGFCRSACALSQKCNQTKSFQNLEHATALQIRMKTFPVGQALA